VAPSGEGLGRVIKIPHSRFRIVAPCPNAPKISRFALKKTALFSTPEMCGAHCENGEKRYNLGLKTVRGYPCKKPGFCWVFSRFVPVQANRSMPFFMPVFQTPR
jgi:hypothetical protein